MIHFSFTNFVMKLVIFQIYVFHLFVCNLNIRSFAFELNFSIVVIMVMTLIENIQLLWFVISSDGMNDSENIKMIEVRQSSDNSTQKWSG